jgi:PEP-CTERM motif-containing protein
MMKKLLVLMLVLGVASLATAGLSVTQTGTTLTIENDTVYDGSAGTGQFQGQLVVDQPGTLTGTYTLDAGAIAVSGSVVYLYTSVPASSFGVGGAELIDWSFMVMADGSPTTFLPVGDVITFDVTGLSSGTLLDESGNVLATWVVPEPITMCLMAVGGLFLRRRK